MLKKLKQNLYSSNQHLNINLNIKKNFSSFSSKTLNNKAYSKNNNYTFLNLNNTLNFNNITVFLKKKINSNASRKNFYFTSKLPLINSKYNKFFLKPKSYKGRSYGDIVCRTKGRSLLKTRYPYINKCLNHLNLTLVAGYFVNRLNTKSYSLCVTSSGEVFYNLTTYNQSLFNVFKRFSLLSYNVSHNYKYLSKHVTISQLFFTLLKLPRYQLISSLEIKPSKGAQYVKASGSKSYITKINSKLNFALVKLPSGVHKIFSVFGTGSLGQIPVSHRKIKTQSNAGYFVRKGVKPLTRGVAKNPVDHPHGGRNKAIKYQRTPWGKTTKYK